MRQYGVALLTVLVVVVIASTVAGDIALQQQLSLRRSALLQHQRQARLYVLGAEQWAVQLLARDRSRSRSDHPGEPWARLPPALPVTGGVIHGQITDLQGRFNINNLVQDGAVVASQLAVLERLLALLELPVGLAQAIADWLDADREARLPLGAEDNDYLVQTPPYLSANQPLVSISELRLIKGIDAAVYAKLSPYVSALPAPTAVTAININSAAPELLAALSEQVDITLAAALIERRAGIGFTSVDEFLRAAALAEVAFPADNLAVTSDYFLLQAQAEVGTARAELSSVLQRTPTGGVVLVRSFSGEW